MRSALVLFLIAHKSLRHQAPMKKYIYEEISLVLYLHKGILRVQDQALITIHEYCNFYVFVRPICHHRVVTTQQAIK